MLWALSEHAVEKRIGKVPSVESVTELRCVAVDGHEDHAAPHARPSSPNTLCRKLDPSRPPPCPRRPLPPSTKTRAKRRQARAAINARAETARTYAFAVLVFAEMLRSFGARSEIKPVWRISLLTNVNLVIVVAMSLGLQVWSQHNATLGSFLKTSFMPLADGFLLLAVGAIPLLILEMVKVGAARRRQRKCDHEEVTAKKASVGAWTWKATSRISRSSDVSDGPQP